MDVEVEVIRTIVRAGMEACEKQGLPMQVPGRTFNSKDEAPSGKWFELLTISDNGLLSTPRLWVGRGSTWGNDQLFKGILRVILHWPVDDRGNYEQLGILADVKAELRKGTLLFGGDGAAAVRLTVYDHPSITDPIDDGTERLFPLTVPYQYFHHPKPSGN